MRRERLYKHFLTFSLVLLTLALFLSEKNLKSPDASVAAATTESVPADQFLQASDGGLAQYGYALQQSTSPSQTLQALADWNSYVNSRGGWGLTTPLIERLATADWNARQAGAPAITREQLAAASTNLIMAKLNTMTAAEQEAGLKQMVSEVTPKGSYGMNSEDPHVAAVQNADGTWRITVLAEGFSQRKAELAALAPGMVSSSSNFYPGEALLVAVSWASGDLGFGGEYIPKVNRAITDLTGIDMTNRYLYGDDGYLHRRPLSVFLTEQAASQFFTELGF